MKRKKRTFIRKITKSGRYARYVVIPKEILRDLGWKEKQKVTVEKYGDGIWVKDWKK